MTRDAARKWLIAANLGVMGTQMIFLFIAPALGYPLQIPKNIELLQVVLPLFVGYLGAAAHFIFKPSVVETPVNHGLLGVLVKGPFAIYVLATTALFVTFGFTNRIDAQPGDGMPIEALSTGITLCLSVLAGITGLINSHLFSETKAG